MKPEETQPMCGCNGGGCSNESLPNAGLPRRDLLKLLGLGAASLSGMTLPVVAGPFEGADFEKLVPADKKLDPQWIQSLFARGERRAYRGRELDHIGLPIGGICAGQVYLGGDGRLWLWDIFNENRQTSWMGTHYREPLKITTPLEQGFAISVRKDGAAESTIKRLTREGFRDVTFYGEYPIGTVEYRDADLPIEVTLEACSPFIPLNVANSSLPTTLMRFTVKNTSGAPIDIALGGWLENAVCSRGDPGAPGQRQIRITRQDGLTFLECDALADPQQPRTERRPDIPFENFEQEQYDGWTVEGSAFGKGPIRIKDVPAYQGSLNAQGDGAVNSHASAPGANIAEKDAAKGILTSRAFTLERDYINFLIGGGNHPRQTCINLLIDGKTVASATGHNDNKMRPHAWDVRRWAGQKAQLQIVDNATGGWGNIGIDQIVFSDTPQAATAALKDRGDFGSMGLALLQDAGSAQVITRTSLKLEELPGTIFGASPDQPGRTPLDQRLIGSIATEFELAPGQSRTITFALVWHFPNARLNEFKQMVGREYATRFSSAGEVAAYLAQHAERLLKQTRLWRDTWYDSTLPHWFLDRTFINTSILATTTCYRFADGRFYGWEGVGCCPGTCLHVWQYAHAVARIFPELERDTRQRVDFGLSFQPKTGIIGYRGPEVAMSAAADGQAGTILRACREHQMSPDSAFLQHNWPKIKRSIEWLIDLDSDRDGVLDRPQYNTLDDTWHGEIAWITSLYLAALRAGQAMAREMNDEEFAAQCDKLARLGSDNINRLFNGEYFIHRVDPKHPNSPGSYGGCEIDQVYGQSWAYQVGLGRIMDAQKVQSALKALWRYNFTPDVGPYRKAYPKGRWYAVAGDGGLLMCTFPRGDADALKKGNETFASYFNECMTGFEYQVAAHMICEGMVMEGLAITRMIHDRYHPLRRNPFNEIECGDHYARAMASFGVYLAACGYEHHGPNGHLGFAPRITPENFKCAFTAAAGWGTFTQRIEAATLKARIDLKFGQLKIASLALHPTHEPRSCVMRVNDVPVQARMTIEKENRILVKPVEPQTVNEGGSIEVELT